MSKYYHEIVEEIDEYLKEKGFNEGMKDILGMLHVKFIDHNDKLKMEKEKSDGDRNKKGE